MDKKTMVILTILCLGIAFMDISGLPGILLKISFSDVDQYIIPLMINFIIIGILAMVVLKLFKVTCMSDMGVGVILFKVISTIGMGIYFGTIYKKTGNLWVPIIMHSFIDICALPYCFTQNIRYETVSLIILVITYITLAFYCISLLFNRKVKHRN